MKFRVIFPLLLLVLGVYQARGQGYCLNWSKDIALTSTAAAASLLGNYLYGRMNVPEKIKKPDELLPWDRGIAGRYSKSADIASDIGALLAVTPFVVGGTALYTGNSNWQEFGTFSLMFVQAALFQNGINLTVRSLEVWPRPYVYSEGKEGRKMAEKAKGEAYGSFFSGHVSAAFTVAVFTSEWFYQTHPNSTNTGIVRALAFSLAGVEGALRVAAGKHYLTDVMVGALVGTGVSYGVLFMHKKRNEKFSFWLGPSSSGITLSF